MADNLEDAYQKLNKWLKDGAPHKDSFALFPEIFNILVSPLFISVYTKSTETLIERIGFNYFKPNTDEPISTKEETDDDSGTNP